MGRGFCLAAVLPGTADADQMRLFANDLRVVPGGEGAEHIAAHDEIELIVRVLLRQMGQRQRRIAGSCLIQLPVRGYEARFSFASELYHPVPLLAGRPLGQLLMGRDAIHHEEDHIEPKSVPGAAGHIQMSVVDGVKATPQNTDLHVL